MTSTTTNMTLKDCPQQQDNNKDDKCDELMQLYSSFINAFDGTTSAFANAKPIMNEVFHSDFTLMTDDGPKDLQWYRDDFAKSFAEYGNKAEVKHIQRNENGIGVAIQNTVEGVELGLIYFQGTIIVDEAAGRSKMIHFAPVPIAEANPWSPPVNNMKGVADLIQRISDCERFSFVNHTCAEADDANIFFVCKQIIHPGKLDSFRSHAQQAIVAIKASEADGTLSFRMHFSSDHGEDQCTIKERYRDSAAAEQHIRNMRQNEHRNAAITECAKIISLEVYGPASAELKELLKAEDYSVAYLGPSV
jgi:quinol monooxygenase YgiN